MREILLHNSNGPIVSKLSRRYLKANRGRNLIAILAIALTTMMLTSLFTLGSGIVDVNQQQTMRQLGGSAHGTFKYITWEEWKQFKEHPSVKAYGTTIFVSECQNKALSKLRTEIRWSDENCAKWAFSMPTTGTLPQADTDFATSTLVLDALGLPHQLGQKIALEFTVHGTKHKNTFTLTGFWEGDTAMPAQALFLSRDYIEKVAPISTQTQIDRADTSPDCTLFLNVMFQNPTNLDQKLEKILTDNGYTNEQITTGSNWAYLSSGKIDLATLLLLILILLLISGAGYLIIYNVFYISVTQDIRNYGLLKTLGTTPRQLRRLVRRQALLLSAAGIPIGIVMGVGLGYFLLPAAISITSLQGTKIPISFHPIIPLGATFFALATVFISCLKPCRMAANVSPIEALRTHEADSVRQNSRKSGHISPLQMSWHNVIRSKKRVFIVVLSLTLSIVLLNSVYGAIRSFDMDKYMEHNILTDFSIAEGVMLTQFQLSYLDPSIRKDLGSLPGVTAASPVYMQEYVLAPSSSITKTVHEFLNEVTKMTSQIKENIEENTKNEGLPTHLYGIDEFLYHKLTFLSSKPSWKEFCTGSYLLASPMSYDTATATVYHTGDTITLTDRNGNDQIYTLLALAQMPYASTPLHGHIVDFALILPSKIYQSHYLPDSMIYLHLKAEEASLPALEQTISNYCASRTVDYHSRATYLADFQELQNTYWLVGGVLAGILGLVGILNYINSIATSIFTRKRELAMLQSIGMTTKQLRKMLILEGIWYLILTTLLTLTFGSLFSAVVVHSIAGSMWFFSFHFSIVPMMICLPLFFFPAIIIPLCTYRSVNKQSMIERLSEE